MSFSALSLGIALTVGGVIRLSRLAPRRPIRLGAAIFGTLFFGAVTAMALWPSQATAIMGCINS